MSSPKNIQSALGKDKHPVEVFANTGPEADPSSHPRAERHSHSQLTNVARVEIEQEMHHKPTLK